MTKEPREIVATELLEGGAPQAQASVLPQTAAREPLRDELVKTVAAEPLESAAIEPLSVVARPMSHGRTAWPSSCRRPRPLSHRRLICCS